METPEPRRISPAEQYKRGRKKRWAARTLNLIIPGLGQLIEGRFIAGCFFMLLCLGGLVLVMIPVGFWLVTYFEFLQSMLNNTAEPNIPESFRAGWIAMGGGFLIVLIAYVWSIANVGGKHPPPSTELDEEEDEQPAADDQPKS